MQRRERRLRQRDGQRRVPVVERNQFRFPGFRTVAVGECLEDLALLSLDSREFALCRPPFGEVCLPETSYMLRRLRLREFFYRLGS